MLVLIICVLTFMGIRVQPENPDDLRRDLANPASATQELTMQYRSNEDYGPYNRAQSILFAQPKFFSRFANFHWAHHLDIPIVEQPDPVRNESTSGLGNTLYRSYLVSDPHNGQSQNWVWGAGPALTIPTADPRLNFDQAWLGGVSVLLLYQPSIFTVGAEATQLWGDDVSQIEVRPIVKLRLGTKSTVGLFDTIRMDWRAPEGDHLTFPMGLEFAELFHGPEGRPVTVSFGAFGNIKRPQESSDWYWRLSINVLMSK
jgi:hypothetical protein